MRILSPLILSLLATLPTTSCAPPPRTVVVKVPVPVERPTCVQFHSPVPDETVVAGSPEAAAFDRRWVTWTVYVDAACDTASMPEWRGAPAVRP